MQRSTCCTAGKVNGVYARSYLPTWHSSECILRCSMACHVLSTRSTFTYPLLDCQVKLVSATYVRRLTCEMPLSYAPPPTSGFPVLEGLSASKAGKYSSPSCSRGRKECIAFHRNPGLSTTGHKYRQLIYGSLREHESITHSRRIFTESQQIATSRHHYLKSVLRWSWKPNTLFPSLLLALIFAHHQHLNLVRRRFASLACYFLVEVHHSSPAPLKMVVGFFQGIRFRLRPIRIPLSSSALYWRPSYPQQAARLEHRKARPPTNVQQTGSGVHVCRD